MLIPKHLLDLMAAGCQFDLVVTTADKRRHSFHQPKQAGFAVKLTEVEAKVNKTAVEVEIIEAFKRFDMMTPEQRDAQGCRAHACGMVVATAGKFAKTFNARLYAVETSTRYCGLNGKRGSTHCFLIPRDQAPHEEDVTSLGLADLSKLTIERAPAPSAADTAALDLARATLANRDAEPSQLVEVTGMTSDVLYLVSPPAHYDAPPQLESD